MYVIDATVYAPLVIIYGKNLVKALKKVKPAILDLTIYEVCNVFWKQHVKFHRISREEAKIACKTSKNLARYLTLYSIRDIDAEETIEIAIENNITFYDASYITLAKNLKTPIASEDKDILNTAPKYNIKTIKLNQLINILKQEKTP
ncbi:MAG: hypothetical protein DRO23_08310 [Thermoprotei archaeon]|nr:MAG: hypothetical protein DRO23_08310 [Thermoprotei archaeon]